MAKNSKSSSKYGSSMSSCGDVKSGCGCPDTKADFVSAPKKASSSVPSGDALTAEIRKTAQQVWEKKGRPNGKDIENWTEAEKIVKKKYGIK